MKHRQRRKVLRMLMAAVECCFQDAFPFEQGKRILRRITGTTRWLAMDADLAAMQVVLESLAVRKQMCGSNLTSLAPFYFFSFCQAAQSTAGRVQSWTQNYKKGFRCRISTSHATLLCSQSFVRWSPFQAKVSRFASYFWENLQCVLEAPIFSVQSKRSWSFGHTSARQNHCHFQAYCIRNVRRSISENTIPHKNTSIVTTHRTNISKCQKQFFWSAENVSARCVVANLCNYSYKDWLLYLRQSWMRSRRNICPLSPEKSLQLCVKSMRSWAGLVYWAHWTVLTGLGPNAPSLCRVNSKRAPRSGRQLCMKLHVTPILQFGTAISRYLAHQMTSTCLMYHRCLAILQWATQCPALLWVVWRIINRTHFKTFLSIEDFYPN